MYVVIFRAKMAKPDQEYSRVAATLRELALTQYGCLSFVAATEGEQEIALSYWQNEDDISRWKSESEHLLAQQSGREKWYQEYQVEVAEIKRHYEFSATP